ncbi:MAG: hypothetical protein K1X39_00250 [Thermoflexales bacterium]|nr:hypothetical protein [Thermoflexales bacterium]
MRFFRNSGGTPVPPPTPAAALREASLFMLALAGLNLAFGVLAAVVGWDFAIDQGAGTHTIVVGLIYLALGLLARRGVKITAAIGAAVFVIEAVLNFGGAVGAGSFSSSWLLSRMLIAYWLIQAARNTLRPTADGSPGT